MDRNGISVVSGSGKEIDPRVISLGYKGDQFVGRKCQNQSGIQCKSDEQIASDLEQMGTIQVSIPIGYLNELSGEIAHFNMSINFTSYPSASQVTLQHHKVYKPESLYTYLPQDADVTDPALQTYFKLLTYHSPQPSTDDYLFSLSFNLHPLQTLTMLSIREPSPLALLTDIASFSLFLSFLAWIICGKYNQFNMERSLIGKLYKCEKNEQQSEGGAVMHKAVERAIEIKRKEMGGTVSQIVFYLKFIVFQWVRINIEWVDEMRAAL